jgi:hypothetical protein
LQLIYHLWPDLVVNAHLDRSLTTIKAGAASRTFTCSGIGVVWGVMDSGIDETIRTSPATARYPPTR